ncbi:MAG: nickel-dependent lactate racemase [Gemmatimonadota bacterium]|nr:nickel-dependent lactate racemase [Gemmatimonadota bacterium]
MDFPYPGYEEIPPAEVPDANVLGVFAPRAVADVEEEAVIARAMANPIGAPVLRDAVRAGDRVLILVDDATRGTPVPRVFRHVIAELEAGGVADDRIALLTAQGTHRRMADAELRDKLGEFYGRFAIHQHDWLDDDSLHDFGRTADGTPVRASRLLAAADFALGIGSIVPHRIKGFSGGAKIAFPGVAGPEIQARNQWEAAHYSSAAVMGRAANPMRHRIEEAARLAGLRYIVNVVTDRESRIVGCFVGDPVLAHRAGCRLSADVNRARLPRRADIVLADSHPADRDLWQSAKGFYAGDIAVRDGGSLIIVSPNAEGVAERHPIVLRLGYRPFPEIARLVEEQAVDDVVGAAVLADLVQIVDRVDCILVSPGISCDQTERLGVRHAPTPRDALAMAFERQGATARVAVLRYGGRILPRIDNASET